MKRQVQEIPGAGSFILQNGRTAYIAPLEDERQVVVSTPPLMFMKKKQAFNFADMLVDMAEQLPD